MGLKVDSSFLKFVTMGALGTRRVQELMVRAGLQPIELERYSRSNKIWATKVKRLRLSWCWTRFQAGRGGLRE